MSPTVAFLYAVVVAALAIAAIGLIAWLEAPVQAPLEPDTTHGLLPADWQPDAPGQPG